MYSIKLPTLDQVTAMKTRIDFGQASPLEVVQNFFYDMIMLPFDAQGRGTASFDDVYKYLKIRDAVDLARKERAEEIMLEDGDYQLLKERVLSWNRWPLMVPEVVVMLSEALKQAESVPAAVVNLKKIEAKASPAKKGKGK